jgi:hypothetical protein
MKKFIVITLAIIIIALILRNAEPFTVIIKTVSDLFGASFRAVTNVGSFGDTTTKGS